MDNLTEILVVPLQISCNTLPLCERIAGSPFILIEGLALATYSLEHDKSRLMEGSYAVSSFNAWGVQETNDGGVDVTYPAISSLAQCHGNVLCVLKASPNSLQDALCPNRRGLPEPVTLR